MSQVHPAKELRSFQGGRSYSRWRESPYRSLSGFWVHLLLNE